MVKKIFILLFCAFFILADEKTPSKELVLFDFESESVLDEFHWKCRTLFSLSDDVAFHGTRSLKLELYPSSYPGLFPALKHHDWRRYKSLCFEVYNPGPENVNIVLRIDDKKNCLEYKDRYNKTFMLLPGANSLKISLDRLKTSGTDRYLELKNIYRFFVFMSHPDKNYILYLDYFRLIPLEPI